MSCYKLWIKYNTEVKAEMYMLNETERYKLIQLVQYNRRGIHPENNYNYRSVTYHVWDIVKDISFVTTDYRTACHRYDILRKEEV